MAGLGWRRFTREKLTVADVQGYLMDQSVMKFDSIAQRDAILVTPSDGMVCYLEDIDSMWYRESGELWRPLEGQWPQQQAGQSLPGWSAGLRLGDRIDSLPYECSFIVTPAGWRQASVATIDVTLAAYITRAKAAGVEAWHNGFQVFNTPVNRLWVSRGGDAFTLIGGDELPPVTSGFPAVGGFAFVGGGTTSVQSLGNGTAQLYAVAAKTDAALAVSATGDVPNTVIGKVPTAYAPMVASTLTSGSHGRGAFGFIAPNGDVTLTAVTPGANIVVGDQISLGGTYRLADHSL